jgi:hypothetical protein
MKTDLDRRRSTTPTQGAIPASFGHAITGLRGISLKTLPQDLLDPIEPILANSVGWHRPLDLRHELVDVRLLLR